MKLIGAFGDAYGDSLDFACPSPVPDYARLHGALELERLQASLPARPKARPHRSAAAGGAATGAGEGQGRVAALDKGGLRSPAVGHNQFPAQES